MADREQLLGMEPYDVYSQAVRGGIEIAVTHGTTEEWYETHPEFKDPEVRERMDQGVVEHMTKILERMAKIPSIVAAVNVDGSYAVHFDRSEQE